MARGAIALVAILLAACNGAAPVQQPSAASADEQRAVAEAEAMIGPGDGVPSQTASAAAR